MLYYLSIHSKKKMSEYFDISFILLVVILKRYYAVLNEINADKYYEWYQNHLESLACDSVFLKTSKERMIKCQVWLWFNRPQMNGSN